MKYNQFQAFEKHLKSAAPDHFSPLYCVMGKDPSERQLVFNLLKQNLVAQFPDLDLKIYNGENLKDEKDFLRDLEGQSLLSNKRLLLLNSCDKVSKNFYEPFEKTLHKMPKDTIILLGAESFTRQSAFYKAIEKFGVVFEIGEGKPWEKEKSLTEWLSLRSQEEKKKITPEAVTLLVRGVNGNLALLASEWEKLLTYTANKDSISRQDVEAISILIPQDSTWQLGEAILQSNSKVALECMSRAISQGNSPIALLRQLRHQIVTALYIASLHQKGDHAAISTKYPYLKGALLDKQLKCSLEFGPKKLAYAIELIDECEFKAKDAWEDGETLLTYLISKIHHD